MSCRYIDDNSWLTCLTFFGGACAYCGGTAARLTADHLIPKSAGGADSVDNIVPACEECNSEKGDRDWREYLMGKKNFSQERMNTIFNWRRIAKEARLGGYHGRD